MTDEISLLLRPLVTNTANVDAFEAGDYASIVNSAHSHLLLFGPATEQCTPETWLDTVRDRTAEILQKSQSGGSTEESLPNYADVAVIALAYINGFLQACVTGPPLDWSPGELCLQHVLPGRPTRMKLHGALVSQCSVDGEAIYHNCPQVGIFTLAKVLINQEAGLFPEDSVPCRWVRLRVNAWHQRLLNEPAPSLQKSITEDVDFLSTELFKEGASFSREAKANFLLERASVNLLHGEDRRAREDLREVSRLNEFKYVLTGRLGKRTKYQTFDTSQLVVLAKSVGTSVSGKNAAPAEDGSAKPESIDLNDDTLLDRIAFTQKTPPEDPKIVGEIPEELQGIDAGNQPALKPLDSVTLLTLATSVRNTAPNNGLTREETLPYAVRVIEGGSNNWQIYSEALLVRSRIEGYRSRTVERSVLQMQAILDQVIAETSAGTWMYGDAQAEKAASSATTFLPRPKPSESAVNTERLQYIHALASPFLWQLEAEVAERWVGIGGLKTALEIYERLGMWAEAALCYASLDDESKARAIIMKQLYEDETSKKEKESLPNDAARLFCILGDLDNDIELYNRSWQVSNQRYSRAQRSLGKHYFKQRELQKADDAYSLSLKVNPQNSQGWFALGCIHLELQNWKSAVEAFSRVVQREPDDAEAWSNLAASLLRLPPEDDVTVNVADDEDPSLAVSKTDPQRNAKQAFVAFKRAAQLKRDSYRIWHNVLNVAATLSPPPYSDIIIAQTRLIDLQSSTEGEGCLDIEVLEGLLNHIVQTGKGSEAVSDSDSADGTSRRTGLERMFVELMDKKAIPLITHSRRLWQLVAKLNIYLSRPAAALDAYEKAWRATLNRPGWDSELATATASSDTAAASTASKDDSPEAIWQEVIDSTIELADAYESLGEREATEGLKAGSGELVCKNWRQKARMAIRSVTGRRAKAGLEGMERLQERAEMLEK